MMAFALFVVGIVVGFAWAADLQLRGGLLRQAREARARPDWVAIDELPPYVPEAIAAVIDPRYLSQSQLRWGEGEVTLARRLARQVHLLSPDLRGAAREMVMGPVLERRLSRRRLLELYLNRTDFGESGEYRIYGIRDAAREYFQREPSELTLGQAATLAGLFLPPRIDDPHADVGAVGIRRNEVLEVLLRGKVITAAEFREARTEPLGFRPGLQVQPMTRPARWPEGEPVIRLPPELRRPTPPDSAARS